MCNIFTVVLLYKIVFLLIVRAFKTFFHLVVD
jgi:hypothetical protein